MAQTGEPLQNGDPSLCGRPWRSEGRMTGPDGVERSDRQISECAAIQPETLNSSDPKLTVFLTEVKKEWWDSGRLPKNILYRYTLTVINDWDKDADYNFSDWEVVHSPYSWVLKSFVLKMFSCSTATIQFLSPFGPELRHSPVNIGLPGENGREWDTIGAGQAAVLVPVWIDYYSEGFRIEKLSPKEAKTKACSSP